jgi:hypothetical protein
MSGRSPINLTAEMMKHVQLGAALHGLSPEDYINTVVRRFIIAANGVLVTTSPKRGGVVTLDALIQRRNR